MKRNTPKLLVADKCGKVFDVPYLEAVGMKGGSYSRLKGAELVKLHPDSELFMLPARSPVGYDPGNKKIVVLDKFPSGSSGRCFAVASFLPPGYTATYSASYVERKKTTLLPLFSYSAVAYYKGGLFAAGIKVDREKRQELAGMARHSVERGIKRLKKTLPGNRLVRHLEKCAVLYGCPAAKNFFLSRYEGPLPASPFCNARCIGCISYQPGNRCPVTQPRITFVPDAEEIAETALYHIEHTKDPVVSFGQGCEGEPLMVGGTLEKAIQIIRKGTAKGVINLNTNAGLTRIVTRLCDAGLNSIRISMNSTREEYYTRYYRPKDYSFSDVKRSAKAAKKRGIFVSINYLVMPGFTDSKSEVDSLLVFLDKEKIDMIQWRNLNYDPKAYFRVIGAEGTSEVMLGVDSTLRSIKKRFPEVMHGYFNPSRARMLRWEKRHEKER